MKKKILFEIYFYRASIKFGTKKVGNPGHNSFVDNSRVVATPQLR